MEAILTRRSIRKFEAQPVPAETINELLQAAMCAPSASDERPWHFVLIDDRNIFAQIHKFHPFAQALKTALCAILVCGDERLEKNKGFWVQDCAAAVENILIAAQAKKLGATWLGVYPLSERIEPMRKLLHIPNHVHPFALIPVGFPAEQKPPVNRFESTRVHFNKW